MQLSFPDSYTSKKPNMCSSKYLTFLLYNLFFHNVYLQLQCSGGKWLVIVLYVTEYFLKRVSGLSATSRLCAMRSRPILCRKIIELSALYPPTPPETPAIGPISRLLFSWGLKIALNQESLMSFVNCIPFA